MPFCFTTKIDHSLSILFENCEQFIDQSLSMVGLGHVGVVVCVFAVVWEERQREAHTTDVFVTVEFGRMHDWTSVTTYSVRTFKTCAYQQISRLETLRIECRSQV